MLVGTIAYITLFQKELLAHIRMVFLTNLTSIYNWYQIHTGQSYLINLRFSLLLHIYGRYLLKDNSICFGLY